MKKILVAALTAFAVYAAISPAEAQRFRGRDRVIIREHTSPVVPLLGTLLTAQIIANMTAPQPPVFVERAPAEPRYVPRYGPDSKAPLR